MYLTERDVFHGVYAAARYMSLNDTTFEMAPPSRPTPGREGPPIRGGRRSGASQGGIALVFSCLVATYEYCRIAPGKPGWVERPIPRLRQLPGSFVYRDSWLKDDPDLSRELNRSPLYEMKLSPFVGDCTAG